MDADRAWFSVANSAERLSEMAKTIKSDVATRDRTAVGLALSNMMREAEAAYIVLIGITD